MDAVKFLGRRDDRIPVVSLNPPRLFASAVRQNLRLLGVQSVAEAFDYLGAARAYQVGDDRRLGRHLAPSVKV